MGICTKAVKIMLLILMMGISFSQTDFTSTLIGGSDDDDTYEPLILEGPDGYIYISGYTSSSDFPTTAGAFDETFNGVRDRFICKFDKDLKTLVASTFLGGSGDETGMGLCFDRDGNLLIAGYTKSTDFPVTDAAYDKSYNGYGDIFIAKMDKDLTTLFASTYYGGYTAEAPYFPRIDIVTNKDNEIYIAGITYSPGMAKNGFDVTQNGQQDLIVAKFNTDLTELIAATYLGSSKMEYRPSILIDSQGNVFVGGDAGASNYPTTAGAFQENYKDGSYDIVISKLSADLSELLASTYVGNTGEDELLSMKLDEEDNLYFIGYSSSKYYPVSDDAYDKTWNGDYDVVISQIDNNLSKINYSTFIGSSLREAGEDFVFDSKGNIYVVGYTRSPSFPVTGKSLDPSHNSGEDVFILKMDRQLTQISASTFTGGNSNDRAHSIIITDNDDIFFTGLTHSTNFPTTENVFSESFSGGKTDCFVAKLNSGLTYTSVEDLSLNEIPENFRLNQNYPNPFNPETKISFNLTKQEYIKIRIFDLAGNLVDVLMNRELEAGKYTITWNGLNSSGYKVSTGIYFCEMTDGNRKEVIKMCLLK